MLVKNVIEEKKNSISFSKCFCVLKFFLASQKQATKMERKRIEVQFQFRMWGAVSALYILDVQLHKLQLFENMRSMEPAIFLFHSSTRHYSFWIIQFWFGFVHTVNNNEVVYLQRKTSAKVIIGLIIPTKSTGIAHKLNISSFTWEKWKWIWRCLTNEYFSGDFVVLKFSCRRFKFPYTFLSC